MKRLVKKLGSALLLCLVVALAGSAWAGGLYLNETGSTAMGTAGAGAQAYGNDASTLFHNPAAMTRLDGNHMTFAGGLLYADTKFDPASDTPYNGDDGGSAGSFAPLLSGAYHHSLSDDLKIGVSMVSVSGAALDYNYGWTGRYQVKEVTLTTLSLLPSVGYRVNDWFSIGGGPQIMYANLDMKVSAPAGVPPNGGSGEVEIDGDDIEFGFRGGALFELSQATRIGLQYLSEMKPNFDGDVTLTGPVVNNQVSTETEIVYPQAIRVGIYHDINDKWALLGTFGWEEWSAFQNITISTGSGGAAMPRNWDDTWHFGGGVHYQLSEPWMLQAGIAYDTSPVDAKDRTADMPMDRQVRYAVGAQYQLNEKISLGGAFEYADYGDADIDGSLLKGSYKNNDLYFLGFNVNWKL